MVVDVVPAAFAVEPPKLKRPGAGADAAGAAVVLVVDEACGWVAPKLNVGAGAVPVALGCEALVEVCEKKPVLGLSVV